MEIRGRTSDRVTSTRMCPVPSQVRAAVTTLTGWGWVTLHEVAVVCKGETCPGLWEPRERSSDADRGPGRGSQEKRGHPCERRRRSRVWIRGEVGTSMSGPTGMSKREGAPPATKAEVTAPSCRWGNRGPEGPSPVPRCQMASEMRKPVRKAKEGVPLRVRTGFPITHPTGCRGRRVGVNPHGSD